MKLEPLAEHALAWLFPRRCPLCGDVLGEDALYAAVCLDCAAQESRLRHTPPRLPATEHDLSGLWGASGAYYYADEIRHAILLCKRYGHPWYSRELTDLLLVHAFGARPAAAPGDRPIYENPTGLPLYHGIVPVPPRSGNPRLNLPDRMAKRLGQVLDIPVLRVLYITRKLLPQKNLDAEERRQNVKNAYAVPSGVDLSGKRILLVDDVITTGATISQCALALQLAGAESVFAVCLAAREDLPKEKQPQEKAKKGRSIPARQE